MKRLWLFVVILSLAVSAFSVFYVAVGATAEPTKAIPYEVLRERRDHEEARRYCSALEEEPARMLSLSDSPESITLGAPEYEGSGYFEMNYTVVRAYTGKDLPESVDSSRLCEFSYFSDGILADGHTFVFADVIIESKDAEKQMYLVNSATVEGYSLLGFVGQRFKNTAALHAELFSGEAFETTLVFAVPEERIEGAQMYINNFGYGSANGTCAYIDLNLGDNQ